MALLTVIQTSYKFLFHSIVNAKWEISWIYFQFIETWAIPSNRQFGGHWHWNMFNYTQSLCLFSKISDFTSYLFSSICDFYRLSLREASQKSLTLWKHFPNITALTFLTGAEGTYTQMHFLTLVCHSWNPFITVDLAKPHFIWGALSPWPFLFCRHNKQAITFLHLILWWNAFYVWLSVL